MQAWGAGRGPGGIAIGHRVWGLVAKHLLRLLAGLGSVVWVVPMGVTMSALHQDKSACKFIRGPPTCCPVSCPTGASPCCSVCCTVGASPLPLVVDPSAALSAQPPAAPLAQTIKTSKVIRSNCQPVTTMPTYGICKVGKDLQGHQVQPSTTMAAYGVMAFLRLEKASEVIKSSSNPSPPFPLTVPSCYTAAPSSSHPRPAALHAVALP